MVLFLQNFSVLFSKSVFKTYLDWIILPNYRNVTKKRSVSYKMLRYTMQINNGAKDSFPYLYKLNFTKNGFMYVHIK